MSTEPLTLEILPDEQKKELLAVVEQNQVGADVALSLQQSFAPLFVSAKSIIEKSRGITVTAADQKLEIKLAREFRLALKNVRVDSDKKRKALKEQSLRTGRAIDGFHAILLSLTETEERRLQEQEDFAEKLEAARKAQLKLDRETALKPFGVDTAFFNLSDMTDDSFRQLLENTQAAHVAKQESVRRAEEERIRQENERLKEEARIREENARLRREADEREAVWKAEREKAEAAQKEADAKAKAEREAFDAQRKKEQDEAFAAAEKTRKQHEAKLAEQRAEQEKTLKAEREAAAKKQRDLEEAARVERAERERLEREAWVRKQAEERQREIDAEAKEAAEAAPDAVKLAVYLGEIGSHAIPAFSSRKGKLLSLALKERMTEFHQWGAAEIESLKPKARK